MLAVDALRCRRRRRRSSRRRCRRRGRRPRRRTFLHRRRRRLRATTTNRGGRSATPRTTAPLTHAPTRRPRLVRRVRADSCPDAFFPSRSGADADAAADAAADASADAAADAARPDATADAAAERTRVDAGAVGARGGRRRVSESRVAERGLFAGVCVRATPLARPRGRPRRVYARERRVVVLGPGAVLR
ncbi:hypothetical protein M885DRAFT_520838 [Pelagophyceae sp. CCMP2097]|nr:hypothetical protein M885DRAFT_520838 [Pelagophyceae sp. CCMP2097]